MDMTWFRNASQDEAVSPVVGTIMMVAVTVVLAATVVAVMNGFGSESIEAPDNLAFKAQAVDSTGNGATDRVKITYVTGPEEVAVTEVTIRLTRTDGTALSPIAAKTTPWSPGDFIIFDPTPVASGGESFFLTVSARGNTVIDQTISVAEN